MPEATRVANWREKTASSRMSTLFQRLKTSSMLERLALLADVEDDQAALAQLLGDLRLRLGLDLAGGGGAGEVHRPEGEGGRAGHRLAALRVGGRRGGAVAGIRRMPLPPARGIASPPSRRLSSSGTEARCSASERVILPGAHQPGQVGVHRLHPDRARGLDRGVDLVRLALADQVADRRGRDQHLGGDDAAHAVGGRQQLLGDDPLQGDRELRPDLALLLRAGRRR